jgi:AraC-like DNA-binding protein
MIEIFDNIRKLYSFSAPCEGLANYIEFFSETSLEATHRFIETETFTVKLFPSYTPTIWINLGSPYQLKNGATWHTIDAHTDVLLLRNEIVERNNLPTDNIFTVKFNPGGFETVLGIPQPTLGSDIIPLQDILPAVLIRKLKNLGSFDDRKQLLQNYFLQKLETNRQQDAFYYRCIQGTIDAFCISGMEAGNSDLARQLCISDKTLYRCFTKVVGTNPKNYLGIVRARTALTAWVADNTAFSPYDYGYYDMSHFYKDVVKFTGQKLSAYHSL